jgi:hypothetical protein
MWLGEELRGRLSELRDLACVLLVENGVGVLQFVQVDCPAVREVKEHVAAIHTLLRAASEVGRALATAEDQVDPAVQITAHIVTL